MLVIQGELVIQGVLRKCTLYSLERCVSASRSARRTLGYTVCMYGSYADNYLTHHLASISLAAVYTDAVHVEEGVDGLKQSALALAPCASE